MIQIQLFGPLAVRVDGRPLPRLRSRKGEWLLALLALRPGVNVERDWLAAMLWPASSEHQGAVSLRSSLADLRRALAAEAWRLRSPSAQRLCLDLDGADVDLLAFETALQRSSSASLQEAVSLYRGPLLEGCAEEWAFPEREVREQAYLQALETLAAQAREGHDLASAERYLERAIQVDPFCERHYRALMEVLALGGNRAALTAVNDALCLRLREELQTRPAPETTALFHSLSTRPTSHALPLLPTPETSLLGRGTAAARRAHGRYYVAVAEATRVMIDLGEQVRAFDHLEAEHDHLRSALGWATETGVRPSGEATVEIGLRLAGALQEFWLVRGHLTEGRRRTEQLLALPAAAQPTTARAAALDTAARLAFRQGAFATARRRREESLAIWRQRGEQKGIADALGALGFLSLCEGDPATAQTLCEESLALSRSQGDMRAVAWMTGSLGTVARDLGEYARAQSLYEEGLALKRAIGDRWGQGSSLYNLGAIALTRRDLAAAKAYFTEALALNREVGNRPWEASDLCALGEVACLEGDFARARTLCGQALALACELGDRHVVAEARRLLESSSCAR